jgi:hypothetical protein
MLPAGPAKLKHKTARRMASREVWGIQAWKMRRNT